ncbi:hypothetical protein E2C01_058216 [Portunus trituberculatus]|uniref:Uncharacterized protein n=1 Tax=Portunus trituberculatus TaxID=210409 RepID=A0A5B7H353_PORTR|nr:hypothetical protein [Portunus trituberculatus]
MWKCSRAAQLPWAVNPRVARRCRWGNPRAARGTTGVAGWGGAGRQRVAGTQQRPWEGGGDAEGVCRKRQKTSAARHRRHLQQDAESVCRKTLMALGGCKQSVEWPHVLTHTSPNPWPQPCEYTEGKEAGLFSQGSNMRIRQRLPQAFCSRESTHDVAGERPPLTKLASYTRVTNVSAGLG